MSEKLSIEVDSVFVKKFFELGDKPVPEKIELQELNKVLEIIKNKLTTAASIKNVDLNNSKGSTLSEDNILSKVENNSTRPKSVLIVDDLGIITVQLEMLFKKIGFEVTVSKELFDALEKYKTRDFGYAVVDFFIPTEREGFILIDEIKKLSLLCKINTKIIVMSASDKKEHKDKCLNRGADHFIEKAQGWQKEIIEICLGRGD